MKNTIQLISLLLVSILSGCATPLSQEAKNTRQIDISSKNSCIFIGSGEASSSIKFGAEANRETVKNNIRNETAANGANSYFTNELVSDGQGHYSATFEMYKCPDIKYSLPTKYASLEKLKKLLAEGVISQKEYDSEVAKIGEANSK